MSTLLEGRIAVLAALEARRRVFQTLYLRTGALSRDTLRVEACARAQGVRIERLSPGAIDAMAHGSTHGGVLLECAPRGYDPPDALPLTGTPLLFCLEGVEDPYNLGNAIRALYAAGCDGLLLSPRDWSSADFVIARASAGAYDNIALYELTEEAAARIHGARIRILLADEGRDARSCFDADLSGPLCIAVGGERRGVSAFVRARASGSVRIPYGRAFAHALPTATAASVLAFEALRQRTGRPG